MGAWVRAWTAGRFLSALLPMASLSAAIHPAAIPPSAVLPVGEGDGGPIEQALRRALRESEERIEAKNSVWPRHDTFDDPWVSRSAHYEVRQVRGQWFGRAASECLDQMWPHFEDLLGEFPSPRARFVVDVHPTIQAYNTSGEGIKESDTAYHSSFSGAFYAKELAGTPVVTYDPRNEETFVRWITHAAAHQYLDALAPSRNLPSWMEEGLASYFEMFWDPVYGDRHVGRCRELLEQRRLLPLSALTGQDASDWDHLTLLQAGLFVHYLLNVCPDTDDLTSADGTRLDGVFRDYLRQRIAGRVPPDHEMAALLRDELGRIEEEYLEWLRS